MDGWSPGKGSVSTSLAAQLRAKSTRPLAPALLVGHERAELQPLEFDLAPNGVDLRVQLRFHELDFLLAAPHLARSPLVLGSLERLALPPQGAHQHFAARGEHVGKRHAL